MIGWREGEALHGRATIRCTKNFVSMDAQITGDHDPPLFAVRQHLNPFFIFRMAAARRVSDMGCRMLRVAEESIKSVGEYRRSAVVEENPHAAFGTKWSRKLMARRTA